MSLDMFPDDIIIRILADHVLTDADKAFTRQVAREMRRAFGTAPVKAKAALHIIKRRVLIDPQGRGTGPVQPEAFASAIGYGGTKITSQSEASSKWT